MAVKKILKIAQHEKFLRTASQPVKKVNREVKQIIEDLKDTMADPSIPALGLAAPQIGSHKRIFGVFIGYYDRAEDDPCPPVATIFINPEIIAHQFETEISAEACLSIPNMSGKVARPSQIVVRYLDEFAATVERRFTGADARAVQHELDHLNGVLFLDLLTSPTELFIHVRDSNGETTLVPYPEVMEHMARTAKAGTTLSLLLQ